VTSGPAPPATRGWGRVAIAVLALAGVGCRVDATIETRAEGRSGVVRARFELDRDAVDALGGRLSDGAQVDDLRRAGWSFTGPRPTVGGGAVVVASKRYGRPADLGRVVAELSGPGGPLQDFALARSRTLGGVRYRLRGVVDLGGGAAVGFPNAPDLARRLQGAGIDLARLEELLRSRAQEGFSLRLRVGLPGDGRGEGVREVRPGQRVEVRAASSTPTPLRPALLGLALLAGLAALGMSVAGRRLR
jgi:hypothetical protein